MKNNKALLSCESCSRTLLPDNGSYVVSQYLQGEKISPFELSSNVMFFVLKGKVSASCGVYDNVLFAENMFGFFPKNIDRHIVIMEDSELMIISLPNFGSICGSQIFIRFYEKAKTTSWRLEPLKINTFVHKFIRSVCYYTTGGLNCSLMHKLKESELVLILKRTYSLDEIVPIIQPIVGLEQQFRDFVLDNYRHVSSVSDLADKAAMNSASFNKKFKEEFGEAPLFWLQKKKTEAILYRIKYTDCTVGDLIRIFEFSSGKDFVKFSHRHFGCPPSVLIEEIRKTKY